LKVERFDCGKVMALMPTRMACFSTCANVTGEISANENAAPSKIFSLRAIGRKIEARETPEFGGAEEAERGK